MGRGGTRRAMGGDSPKEHRSPLKPGKGRRGKVESRLFQRMPQRTRQKHQRRLLRAVRAVPRTLALVVVLYAVSLVVYFGKYRVRPRHHHAPELPAVLREGEVETSSARRLLCSAAPLRDRSPLFGDDDGFGFGFGADGGAGGGRGGARERDDGAPGGVPSRIDGVSTLGAGHSADASASGGDGATTDASSSRRSGKKTTRDDAGSSAGSAFTSTRGAPLSIKRGRFRGHPKTFRPPDRELSGLNATDARVFVLAGAAASDPAAPALLEQFLRHYVDVAKVPASHLMVVVHARDADDDDAVDAMVSSLRERRVFHEVWEGEALLFSAVAHHWENHLANAGVDEEDWIVVADLDEHVTPPVGQTVPSFLGSVDEMGYSLVHGAWVDRVAESGELVDAPGDATTTMSDAFPLRCSVGACGGGAGVGGGGGGGGGHGHHGHGHAHTHGHGHGINAYALHGLRHHSTLVGVVGGGERVWAHRAQYPILDVRTLQDFGLDDVVTASRLAEDHTNAYPVPLKVQHYQWRRGAADLFERRARGYEACDLRAQRDAVAGLLRSLARSGNVVSQAVCPDIVCHREDDGGRWAAGRGGQEAGDGATTGPRAGGGSESANRRSGVWAGDAGVPEGGDSRADGDARTLNPNANPKPVPAPVPIVHDAGPVGNGGAPGGYPGERRVVIFASVWTHVDGVSRTMKRLAHHLASRPDSSVFVMSPDLAERDFVEAANNERFHVADVPHVPMPGRGEYKMAAPLQARQRHQIETFGPHVVHVAAPDMLGHSAVRWAAENGVCSVCSYHTAYDTYLQYYRVGVLATPLRQMLGGFYSSCDVVATPSYAAAEHLSDMGVPRERMGFFPRGINLTMYSPAQRSLEFRREVMGVGSRSSSSGGGGSGAWPRRAGRGDQRRGRGDSRAADAGTEDGEVVILWVARIVREKGLGSFAKTITELLAAKAEGSIEGLPPFRVVVAGEGPDLPWLRRQIERFPEVKILGHTGGDRLSRTYAAGDIFFFPSRTEVIPNNLIESMASGLAVVTDDVGVNRAIVKDGVTGVLVGGTDALPGDVTAYVDALVSLLRDPATRKRMSKAARKSTHGLTWERTFGSLRRSYDRCRPGRPYARHLDPNVPGSKAASELAARDAAYGDDAVGGGGGVASAASAAAAHEEHGMSVSGALLGISAAAAGGGGGGVASALAAASSALWHPRHHEHAAGHAAATLQAAHERRVDSHLEDSGTPSRTTTVGDDDAAAGGGGGSESSGSGRSVGGRASDPGDPRRVPGSGPGAVNVGGVRERDVIVDPGAPAGSLLYRLSYGMTGGYVRSMEDARADDEAIAAAEAAAEEAAARALATGTWGGGGLMGAGGGFFVGSRQAKTARAAE